MPLKGLDDDLEDEDEFEDGGDYPRHFEDLTPAEKQTLSTITPATIQSCEVIRDWMDDHQVCVLVNINGIEVGAWWCGWETAGAFLYADSPKAKIEICEYIKQSIANATEDFGEETNEDEITPEDLPNAHSLEDKDKFSTGSAEHDLKNYLWEQITSHAQAQGLNWREMSERLRELAAQSDMQAEEAELEDITDEVTPGDLPPYGHV